MLKDYYGTLEIPSSASPAEISQAYKRLAKLWHPDRNKAPDSTARMQEINEAYLILKDPQKRARYDEAYARHFSSAQGQRRSQERESDSGADEERKAEPEVDPELEAWIAEARRKAKEMLTFTLEETGNILKEGLESALASLIIPGIIAIIALIFFAARSCR